MYIFSEYSWFLYERQQNTFLQNILSKEFSLENDDDGDDDEEEENRVF